MNLHIDAKGIEEAQKALAGIPQGIEKATARSLNRAILAARTAGSKGVRETYTIKASDLKANMTLRKAGYSNLKANLAVAGSPIDLMKFKTKIKKNGITAQVKKGSGTVLAHSFFVTTGNMGIYHRSSGLRLPIQKEFGPSMPQMMGNPDITQQMEDHAQQTMEERMPHEIAALLGGYTS